VRTFLVEALMSLVGIFTASIRKMVETHLPDISGTESTILTYAIFGVILIGVVIAARRIIVNLRKGYHMSKTLNMIRDNMSQLKTDMHSFSELSANGASLSERRIKYLEFLQRVIDDLADNLSKCYFFTRKISVCVKLLDSQDSQDTRQNMQLYTFIRSANTSDLRGSVDISKDSVRKFSNVADTSYYYSIMYHNCRFFANGHLRRSELIARCRNKPHPTNSHSKYWKYYKSTIIFPIRIKQTFSSDLPTIKYRILGFLCIDVKKNMSKWHVKPELFLPKNFFGFLRNRYDYWLLNILGITSDWLYFYLDAWQNASGRRAS
jgi:hypothetical protein